MNAVFTVGLVALSLFGSAQARELGQPAASDLAAQNAALSKNTEGKGFGPQAPRDLSMPKGKNKRVFSTAPDYRQMNLCNIHFHKNAEHKGGEFTKLAQDSHAPGVYMGYQYSGKLSEKESKPLGSEVCKGSHGGLQAGDTIEMHYVHSSAQVTPGPTLNSCLSESVMNPQLRVEAQVFVLVNDPKAGDFVELSKIGRINGYHQAVNIPKTTGKPIQYAGSTTGPIYNEKGSALQVTWSVRPKVMKVSAESVGRWCSENPFKEDHAHGVRNLVVNEELLSEIAPK